MPPARSQATAGARLLHRGTAAYAVQLVQVLLLWSLRQYCLRAAARASRAVPSNHWHAGRHSALAPTGSRFWELLLPRPAWAGGGVLWASRTDIKGGSAESRQRHTVTKTRSTVTASPRPGSRPHQTAPELHPLLTRRASPQSDTSCHAAARCCLCCMGSVLVRVDCRTWKSQ